MRRPTRILLQGFLCLLALPVTAQTHYSLDCKLETAGMTGVGDHAPFWHTSNRQGLPSVDKSNGYMHAAALGSISNPKGFGMDYVVDLGGGAGLQSNLFIHQLYIDLDYKWLGLSAGMKEHWNDKNISLSSGALTWSGNCRPLPEIRIGIPDYVRFKKLGGWFSIKGHLGYGWLTDDTWRKGHAEGFYTQGTLFHTKSGFLRIGDLERFPLEFKWGLEMNNMFGGVLYKGGTTKQMPSDAAAYWTVMFPFHQVEHQGTEDGDNFGSWHYTLTYKLDDWYLSAYYEHFYEDHSSMLGVEYKNNTQGEKDFIHFGLKRNWLDALYGFEVKAPEGVRYFRNAVLEFMNTRNLCGPIRHSATDNVEGMQVIEEVDGRDDMYNHMIYSSDTHWGYAMGSPIMISPAYNSSNINRFRSNRVQMFHLGVDGGIADNIDYRFMVTTTRHWGCYGTPLDEVERVTSLMLECSYRLGNTKFSLSGAMDVDSGDLLGNNKGVMLTISKLWKVI